jgi:hypothetical protein
MTRRMSRPGGDQTVRLQPRTTVICDHGHDNDVQTSTARMIRCLQCASDGRVTWLLTDPGSAASAETP